MTEEQKRQQQRAAAEQWQSYRFALLAMQLCLIEEKYDVKKSKKDQLAEWRESEARTSDLLDIVGNYNRDALCSRDNLRTFDLVYFFLKKKGKKRYSTIQDEAKMQQVKTLMNVSPTALKELEARNKDFASGTVTPKTIVHHMLGKLNNGSLADRVTLYRDFRAWLKTHVIDPEVSEQDENTLETA